MAAPVSEHAGELRAKRVNRRRKVRKVYGSPSVPFARTHTKPRVNRVAVKARQQQVGRYGRPQIKRSGKVVVAPKVVKRRAAFRRLKRTVHAREAFLRAATASHHHFNHLMGRGPWDLYGSMGAVDRANYEGYAKRLWPKVRSAYGLPDSAPMPKLIFDAPRDQKVLKVQGKVLPVSAYVPPGKKGKRSVHVTYSGAMGARLRPIQAGAAHTESVKQQRGIPVHEWAHVYQGRSADRSKADAEGGAEAFTRDVMRALGHPYHRKGVHHAYDPYVEYVRKHRGRRWIRSGQFK
jgi:hypothetical protein